MTTPSFSLQSRRRPIKASSCFRYLFVKMIVPYFNSLHSRTRSGTLQKYGANKQSVKEVGTVVMNMEWKRGSIDTTASSNKKPGVSRKAGTVFMNMEWKKGSIDTKPSSSPRTIRHIASICVHFLSSDEHVISLMDLQLLLLLLLFLLLLLLLLLLLEVSESFRTPCPPTVHHHHTQLADKLEYIVGTGAPSFSTKEENMRQPFPSAHHLSIWLLSAFVRSSAAINTCLCRNHRAYVFPSLHNSEIPLCILRSCDRVWIMLCIDTTGERERRE
jgi:hypothetical protein